MADGQPLNIGQNNDGNNTTRLDRRNLGGTDTTAFEVVNVGDGGAILGRGLGDSGIVPDRPFGVWGDNGSGGGNGVLGTSFSAAPNASGVCGRSVNGTGVIGEGPTGVRGSGNPGVEGTSGGRESTGVRGEAGGGESAGVRGTAIGGSSAGVVGTNRGGGDGVRGTGMLTGVRGTSNTGPGVIGKSVVDPTTGAGGDRPGVLGESRTGPGVEGTSIRDSFTGTGGTGPGVRGTSGSGEGVRGQSDTGRGVAGASLFGPGMTGVSLSGDGVSGQSILRFGVVGTNFGLEDDPAGGVLGQSNVGIGVTGQSNSGTGVMGDSPSGPGVVGQSDSGTGVVGDSISGLAGEFFGNVRVRGRLFTRDLFVSRLKLFKIDHPLDPENKYLSHSSVESPEMKNLYDGVVELDEGGSAWVELPEWFEALNRDYRYQLTPIGGSAPELHVAEEISNNHFRVAGGGPGMKISWQVSGVRRDASAVAEPMRVEEEKAEGERGYYLDPEAHGEPLERAITCPLRERRTQRLRERRAPQRSPSNDWGRLLEEQAQQIQQRLEERRQRQEGRRAGAPDAALQALVRLEDQLRQLQQQLEERQRPEDSGA